jgi:hypothetical protein
VLRHHLSLSCQLSIVNCQLSIEPCSVPVTQLQASALNHAERQVFATSPGPLSVGAREPRAEPCECLSLRRAPALIRPRHAHARCCLLFAVCCLLLAAAAERANVWQRCAARMSGNSHRIIAQVLSPGRISYMGMANGVLASTYWAKMHRVGCWEI